MDIQLYNTIMHSVAKTVKRALNESFIDDEDEIEDSQITFGRYTFSLEDIEQFYGPYLIFSLNSSVGSLYRWKDERVNGMLDLMKTYENDYFYSYNVKDGYKLCKYFSWDEALHHNDDAFETQLYIAMRVNIDNIKSIIEFREYLYKTVFNLGLFIIN